MFGQRPAFGGTSFGGFGTNTTTTGFGSSAFGRPAFGAPTTTAATPFGATPGAGTSLFGQNTSTGTTGGLFGSTPQTSTTGFGATSGFGTSGGSLFGASQPQQTGGLFGATNTTGFNAAQNQARPFSFSTATTSASTGLFGTTNTASTGGLFGTTPIGATQGTTIKYNAVTGTDTVVRSGTTSNITTRIEVITAMKEYETKSLEELRVEDYIAGRKGGGTGAATAGGFGFGQQQNKGFLGAATQPATGGSLFGTTATTGGLFGQKPPENKSLFGTTTTGFGAAPAAGTSLFGTPTVPFGQTATTSASTGFSFGQPQNKSTGFLFGQTSSAPSLFGQPTSAVQTSSSFGTPAGGFSFGNQAANTGLFGQQNKPVFGQTQSTGLFGAKPATTGFTGFGTTPTASPFGTANTAATGVGLFGNQAKPGFALGGGTGLFGQPNTGFGQTSSIFGQNPNVSKPGGLFGQPTTGFGTNTGTAGFNFSQPTPGTGLFGNTGNTGGLFGNTGLNTGSQFGAGLNTNAGFNMGNPQNQVVPQGGVMVTNDNVNNLIRALTHTPFGNSTLLKSAVAPTGKADELLNASPATTTGETGKPSANRKPTYVLPSSSANSPKPIGLNRITPGTNGANPSRNILFAGLEETSNQNTLNDDPFKAKAFPSVRKLNLKVFKNMKGGTGVNISMGSPISDTSLNGPSALTTPISASGVITNGITQNGHPSNESSPTPDIIKGRNNLVKTLNQKNNKNTLNDTIADLNVGMKPSNNMNLNGENPMGTPGMSNDPHNISLFDNSILDESVHHVTSTVPHVAGINLTRNGYYTLPSIDDLSDMVDSLNNICLIENFTVGRVGYGNICFLGITDVFGLNIDALVHIVRKEVDVYPEGYEKPTVGEGLNKPALVTLDCVWPVDKTSRDVIKSEDRLNAMGWSEYLERRCLKMDASFVEYRPETGSWVFKVKHFSKYGLQEEAEDQETSVAPPLVGGASTIAPPLVGGASAVVTPLVGGVKFPQMDSGMLVNMETPMLAQKKDPVALFTGHMASTGVQGPPAMGLGLVSPPPKSHLIQPYSIATGDILPRPSLKSYYLDGTQSSDYYNREESIDFSSAVEPLEGAVCPMSPSAERLTVSSRTKSRDIQAMKSHLFYADDDADDFGIDDDFQEAREFHSPGDKLYGRDDEVIEEDRGLPGYEFKAKSYSKKLMLSGMSQVQPVPLENRIGTSVVHQRVSSPNVEVRVLDTRKERVKDVSSLMMSTTPVREARTKYNLLPTVQSSESENFRFKTHHLSKKVDLGESLATDKDCKAISDAGVMFGRSFRVGWGPNWSLVHPGKRLGSDPEENNPSLNGDHETEYQPTPFLFLGAAPSTVRQLPSSGQNHSVTIENLHLTDNGCQSLADKPFMDTLLESCLRNVLECSNRKKQKSMEIGNRGRTEGKTVPHFKPDAGIDLLHRLAMTTTQLEDDEGRERRISSIFDLCAALWGQLEFYSEEDEGASIYNEAQARKEALSRWIEEESGGRVEREVEESMEAEDEEGNDGPQGGYLSAIFSHLTVRQIEEACDLAQRKADHHLALLLSQCCLGDSSSRQIVNQQLNIWTESGLDKFVSEKRLELYSLLAGVPTYKDGGMDVNTCRDLDWKRALGLHMWYFCQSTSTIAEALDSYEKAAGLNDQENNEIYCDKPVPDYWSSVRAPVEWSSTTKKETYSMAFHILKLFVDSSHNLSYLLEPSGITPDPLSVSISWLLWAVLDSLGYSWLAPSKIFSLHKAMAAQLEAQGHWQWAIFILHHIPEETSRISEVFELLCRHVTVDGETQKDAVYTEKEFFLLSELELKPEYLHKAKAIRAKSLNLTDEEAWYRIKANDFPGAHDIIIDTIAPKAIIHEDHAFLKGYLREFLIPEVQVHVPGWSHGGGIYYDYMDVCGQVETMRESGEPTGAMIEKMRPKLLALCSRLNNLKASTAIHSLAISEMSRMVVSVLRAFLTDDISAVKVLAQQVADLPLTHECAFEEMNIIMHQYLAQVAGTKD